jgi:hypothetical protein
MKTLSRLKLVFGSLHMAENRSSLNPESGLPGTLSWLSELLRRPALAQAAFAPIPVGPPISKTAAGKAWAVQNALRHGLNVPVRADPEVETIARKIAGPGADAETLELARRIGEAQVDLNRVRAHRAKVIGRLFTSEDEITSAVEPEHQLSQSKYLCPLAPSPQRLMRFLDLGSYRTAWLMAQRIREALYRRGIEKRARPATLHVVTEGDARNTREVTFDDAVRALIACPRTHGTRSNAQRHAGDRNGGEGEIFPFANPLRV